MTEHLTSRFFLRRPQLNLYGIVKVNLFCLNPDIPGLASTHFCKNPIASEKEYFLEELKSNRIIIKGRPGCPTALVLSLAKIQDIF